MVLEQEGVFGGRYVDLYSLASMSRGTQLRSPERRAARRWGPGMREPCRSKRKIVAAATLVVAVHAPLLAQGDRARDLCNGPCAEEFGDPARPGVRVSILLEEKGRVRTVPPNHPFRSGDQIRLVLNTNFTAYIAVSNSGTSGNVTRLYPGKGEPVQLKAKGKITIPGPDARPWYFDDNPGTEKLTVVMSSRPVEELARIGSAFESPEQADRTLADLNSRALERTRQAFGRDLCVGPCPADGDPGGTSDASYVLTNQNVIKGPTGFTIMLKHERAP